MPAELHVYGHENGNERPLASLVRPITDARLSDEPRPKAARSLALAACDAGRTGFLARGGLDGAS